MKSDQRGPRPEGLVRKGKADGSGNQAPSGQRKGARRSSRRAQLKDGSEVRALVDALRKTMLEGLGIGAMVPELMIMTIWMVVTFWLALLWFRWS